MSDERQRWIEAAKVLSLDADAKVRCPRCAAADLAVEDVALPPRHVERHLSCPACSAYNAMIMAVRDPPP